MITRLKRGTVRESDGWRFGNYKKAGTSFKEVWLSPAAYSKWVSVTRECVRNWKARQLQPISK